MSAVKVATKKPRNLKKPRDSRFELLRAIAIVCVIWSHLHMYTATDFDTSTVMGALVHWSMRAGKVGVFCFALITGYFMAKSKFRLESLIKLISQVFCFSVTIQLALIVFGINPGWALTPRNFIAAVFPITFNAYWNMTAYVVAYLTRPLLIPFLNGISKWQYRQLLVFLGIFCSLMPALHHHGGITVSGFTFILTGFIIGTWFKLHPEETEWFNLKRSLLVFAGVLTITILAMLIRSFPAAIGGNFLEDLVLFLLDGEDGVLSGKFAPLTIAVSVALFLVILRIPLKPNRFINIIGPAALAVYLFQSKRGLFNPLYGWLDGGAHDDPWVLQIGYAVVVAICIYSVGVGLYYGMRPLQRQVEKLFLAIATKVSAKVSPFILKSVSSTDIVADRLSGLPKVKNGLLPILVIVGLSALVLQGIVITTKPEFGAKQLLAWMVNQTLTAPAIPLVLLIGCAMGYYFLTAQPGISIAVRLLVTTWCFTVVLQVAMFIAGPGSTSQNLVGQDLLNFVMRTLFPTTFNVYWLLTAFTFLTVLMPILNRVIKSLDEASFRRVLLALTLLVGVWPIVYSDIGISASNLGPLVFAYSFGAYIRVFGTHWLKVPAKKIWVALVATALVSGSLYVLMRLVASKKGSFVQVFFHDQGWVSSKFFTSPWNLTLMVFAALLFLLVIRIEIPNSSVLTSLGRAAVGGYILSTVPLFSTWLYSSLGASNGSYAFYVLTRLVLLVGLMAAGGVLYAVLSPLINGLNWLFVGAVNRVLTSRAFAEPKDGLAKTGFITGKPN